MTKSSIQSVLILALTLMGSPVFAAPIGQVSLSVHATLSFCSPDIRDASCVPAGVDGRSEVTVELKGTPDFSMGRSNIPFRLKDPDTGAETVLDGRLAIERTKADGEFVTRVKFEPLLSVAGGAFTPLTKTEIELLQWPGIRTFSSAGVVRVVTKDLRWEFLFFPGKLR